MSKDDRDYTNGEIVVHWRPALCVHCQNCWNGLPAVFDPDDRPWVCISAALSERIRAQVAKCPSGALTVSEASQCQ